MLRFVGLVLSCLDLSLPCLTCWLIPVSRSLVRVTCWLRSHPYPRPPPLPSPHLQVTRALEILLDERNHPILMHCNKGKHRVGCVVGILRKMQSWSLTAIFDEYRRFAGAKGRLADQEYIERFQGPVHFHQQHRPAWL